MNAAEQFPLTHAKPITPRDAEAMKDVGSLFSSGEVNLTIVIFLFGLLALTGFYLLVRAERATPYLLRLYVILILVFGTLLVVSSSYTTDQIAPVVGFFGTIAGYLLGRSERRGENNTSDDLVGKS